jgi:alginate O-acetyltransferase complex protein AlgI
VLFNSFEFFIFLPLVFVLYWFVANKELKTQNLLILIASYFFYGWWSWKFMGLLALSTFLDYLYGFGVASPIKRKAKFFLWLSIVNNLGILAIFKYYNFFADQFASGLQSLGLHVSPYIIEVALPVGISFYTFHGMSYVFDIYRGKQKPVRNFIDYGVFVAFFPLLVAGPIERANHLLPQVQKKRTFDYTQAVEGCRLILWGLFKKIVIADSLAGTVDSIFNNYGEKDGVTLAIGAVAFAFQIYGDFSGYSDIAIGTAKLFGFELLSNFRFPYFSRDVAEFWRRWHISLSSWFRDYLYIPLGGSKQGKTKAVVNTFIIFLVSGFWHGASWNFIAWGFIHACGFLPLLLAGKHRQHRNEVVANDRHLPTLKEFGQMLATFTFVTFAWIFFRAETMSAAVGYITQLVRSLISDPAQLLHYHHEVTVFAYIVPFLMLDWTLRRDERILAVPSLKAFRLVTYSLVIVFILLTYQERTSFLYFQF